MNEGTFDVLRHQVEYLPVQQIPTIGRIVHFVDGPTASHRAAMVIDDNGTLVVDLYVYEIIGRENYKISSVTYDETGNRPGSWHWPERKI